MINKNESMQKMRKYNITKKIRNADYVSCVVLFRNKKTGKFWKAKEAPKNDPYYEECIKIYNGEAWVYFDSPANSDYGEKPLGDDWEIYISKDPKHHKIFETK